jgi:hypothetical protein
MIVDKLLMGGFPQKAAGSNPAGGTKGLRSSERILEPDRESVAIWWLSPFPSSRELSFAERVNSNAVGRGARVPQAEAPCTRPATAPCQVDPVQESP